MALAMDVASTEFHRDGLYHLEGEGRSLEPSAMVELFQTAPTGQLTIRSLSQAWEKVDELEERVKRLEERAGP